ncbi:PAS domain-containing protein [Thioalkalivibrio sp. XN279]|uniref:PAS domain-containing protein n=1 Tax=Thioalkalivibrio sp. XN279 TaxID=2714953 RepID=UPI00140B956B|nr:PAS domain-containing protein [Thioalkalivibrio sp. XN279]NHA13533.1 PAS domain-containing protein [Thioalkalivibrio sp. XN279]
MSDTLRILLIADAPETIRKVGQGLHQGGGPVVSVEGADSLATASRRLRAGDYDLALADVSLGQDGLHLLSELVATAPGLPVVALAHGADAAGTAACLSVGALDRIAVEALDGPGLLDRLQAVVARARASHESRQRSQRIAASLGAGGELAWHYEAGDKDVWLASPEPEAWQLPGPECRESLEALRSWLHPDDRELALRRLAEVAHGAEPWELEARVKVGGGAYRWCALRGRSQLDGRGRLARAAGVVTDAQRQHKRLLALQHDHRFMRAVFDSARVPQAVLDAAAVITHCNQAWTALQEPGCHAGEAFAPGRRFTDSGDDAAYGDLDMAALARGLKQVLGGVLDQYQCEYGDDTRRWRISISPLLNPGIAGALVTHEEVTTARKAEKETRARLAGLARDFQAIAGPVFRLGADFEVRAANEAAMKLGREPVLGRDIFKVLPRVHGDAVSDGLAALASGRDAVSRDVRAGDGRTMRWLLAVRRDGADEQRGFLLQAIDVSDLAPPPRTERENQPDARLQELAELLASAEAAAQASQAELERLRSAADDAKHAGEKLRLEVEQARLDAREARLEAEDAVRREARGRQAREELEQALAAERARAEQAAQAGRTQLEEALEKERRSREQALAELQGEQRRLRAALDATEAEAAQLRQAIEEAHTHMRAELARVLDQALGALALKPGPAGQAGNAGDRNESGKS